MFYKSEDGHFYKSIENGAVHINPEGALINILNSNEWTYVLTRYRMNKVTESEFLKQAELLMTKLNEAIL